MSQLKSLLHKLRQRGQVRPLRDTQLSLQRWCQTPLGQVVLRQEQQLLEEELSCLFGYHFLQLSIAPQSRLYRGSRISHCFALGASETSKTRVQALSELEALPLAESSVDVTLLHHVLEFSQNPQQVLKEAARITIPNGHIIIFGFNPWSFMGAAKPLARMMGFDGIWRRHSLRRARLEDWLQFLDFTIVSSYQGCCNLPINQRSYLKRTNRLNAWQSDSVLGLGNYYCLVARKEVCCVTPLKPKWEAELIPAVVSMPKQSIAAVNRRSASAGAIKPSGSSNKSIIDFSKKR